MAAIYDYETGNLITGGLQGCTRCDEAIDAALRIALDRGEPVVLYDDDGLWYVRGPGAVRPLNRYERIDGGWSDE